MKIQNKITLLFFGLATLGLVLLNAAIFYFVSEFNFEDFFKRLEARVNLAAEIKITPDARSSAYEEVRNRYLEKLDDERDHIIKIDPYHKMLFPRPVNLPDEFYKAIIQKGKARYSEDNRFYAGGYFNTARGPYIVIVGASDPYGFKELQELKRVLAIGFFASLACIYVVGIVFSNYTMRPFRQFIKSVKTISADNLNLRLKETGGKDEVAELVLTFNHMLTRLETAFETQNNFVSNASHELRTPLAIITAETELLLQQDLNAQSRNAVEVVLKEAEKLNQIITSLLGLAQSGFDGKKQNWQKVRVDELILDVIASVRKIIPECAVDLDYSALPQDESLLYTDGITNLLHLSVTNIVMNACKYSSNQPVKIALTVENGRIIISVTDRGIGIPENELQYIFEPFFRASNTGSFEGYGIGLPLTLNIIRLHKGSIGIRSEVGEGTEIQVLLPSTGNYSAEG
ncbi:HAMP domain-containing sensor histidine kinase [Pedobacter sp. JY14-1]|uniref:HAMP domain-containing sensor histidine kinase n=1 Tax=Pedobacter sp. JY14-1 TaxID=3034151 RepID=UPI0023E0E7B5|nr:HAMP domain-containing sensor histidine kinase [Pedobacter sp. JY14-1]